jgi:hypothetical protein
MVAYTAATLPTVITANRPSTITQNIKLVSASLSVVATRSAFFPSGNMPLRYVGQTSLSTDLTNKKYVDAYQARPEVAVTQSWLNTRLASSVSDIVTPAQIDTELAKYVTKKRVRDDQLTYFDASLLGAPSGLAKTSGMGKLTIGQHIPGTISTDNVAKFYDASLAKVASFTTSQTVTQNNAPREFLAAQFDIPDPGYSYYPMNFVYIQGKSQATEPDLKTSGTGNTGLITVYSITNSTYYAYGTCTDTWLGPNKQNWHVALPHGDITSAPSAPASPVKGSIKLGVYLSNYTMSNYTFYASGMTWLIILMPVVGN